MTKVKEFFQNVLSSLAGIFFILLFFYGEIFGVIHSIRKHSTSDAILCVVIPPMAWWRSIEMFWHDDFADVDWDERLSSDLKTCVYFHGEIISSQTNTYQLNEDIENFAKKVKKYPEDKREFLVNGFRKYLEFQNLLVNDLYYCFDRYFKGAEYELKLSSKTKNKEKELEAYISKSDLEILKNGMDEMAQSFKPEKSDLTTEKIEEIESFMQVRMKLQKLKSNQLFDALFDVEF